MKLSESADYLRERLDEIRSSDEHNDVRAGQLFALVEWAELQMRYLDKENSDAV
jgi:hypothetical protein